MKWYHDIQAVIDEIDICIKGDSDNALLLRLMAEKLGCSESHLSRKFHEISGMKFRDYVHARKLAFALKDIRDTDRGLIDIALDYGFSSHEAFTRAFRELYGISPSQYRRSPVPVPLRTIIRPFDCYIAANGAPAATEPADEIKIYFITIPAHKFLHIRNYESIGYWDFWQKQALIPGQDCESICGLLDSIPGKLDDMGGDQADSGSGQIMGYINEPAGRICSWGIPLAEAYGVRLSADYSGPAPEQMLMMDVPEGEYIVFEHGPFDFAAQNCIVEQKIEAAMRAFDYAASGYALDLAPGRIFYFFHDCARYWKFIRPVRKT